jgi:hypothetical protein
MKTRFVMKNVKTGESYHGHSLRKFAIDNNISREQARRLFHKQVDRVGDWINE